MLLFVLILGLLFFIPIVSAQWVGPRALFVSNVTIIVNGSQVVVNMTGDDCIGTNNFSIGFSEQGNIICALVDISVLNVSIVNATNASFAFDAAQSTFSLEVDCRNVTGTSDDVCNDDERNVSEIQDIVGDMVEGNVETGINVTQVGTKLFFQLDIINDIIEAFVNSITFLSDVIIGGDLTVNGTAEFNDNVTINNNLTVNQSILPGQNNTGTIGLEQNRWAQIFTEKLNTSELGGFSPIRLTADIIAEPGVSINATFLIGDGSNITGIFFNQTSGTTVLPNVTVLGQADFENNISVRNNASIGDRLTVGSTATIAGSASVGGALSVGGSGSFGGSLSADNLAITNNGSIQNITTTETFVNGTPVCRSNGVNCPTSLFGDGDWITNGTRLYNNTPNTTVGIGKIEPGATLDVVGTTRLSFDGENRTMRHSIITEISVPNTFTTIHTISPSTLTDLETAGFIYVQVYGDDSACPPGAVDTMWWFEYTGAALNKVEEIFKNAVGDAPTFRLFVSGNDILLQVESCSGTYTGTMQADIWLGGGNGADGQSVLYTIT